MKSKLRHNDEIREEERVHMAQNTIIIYSEFLFSDELLETSSDESSGLGRMQIPTKTVMSSNKESIFPDKHKYDNEETPL